MDIIFNYVLVFALILMLLLSSEKLLKAYQDTRYKLREVTSLYLKYYKKYFLYFLLILFIFLPLIWYFKLLNLFCLVGNGYLLIRKKNIVKLRYTSRIIRQIIVITIIDLLMIYFFPLKLIPLLNVLNLIAPIVILLSGLTIYPVELLISSYYKLKALKKLKLYKPIIIGVTGSCGKTSVKNYLYEILKDNLLCFMSPKSFNTINGISMTINEYLKYHNSFLILEMGATKVKDIEALVKYTYPTYGIITEIVPQHLNTFKSIDNIIKEKFKLIEGLPENGVGFLNYDNLHIRNYPLKAKCKVITYGTTSDCHIYASEVKMNFEGMSFQVNLLNDAFNITTSLVGRHNINNLLAAIALSFELGVSKQEIIDTIKGLKSVKHRLDIYQENNITIIDDAYNSNIQGFKNALEVLSLAINKKILLTPGIVEAGKETRNINYSLASEISKVCDEVILVDNESARYLYEGLQDQHYHNILVVNSFQEGFNLITEGTVLIENDLPDNYFI